ncbi:MAG: hypothetical protein PHF63_00870 [Herbinix sp.]|nr:hypothetical protein [Herbinix sp.]
MLVVIAETGVDNRKEVEFESLIMGRYPDDVDFGDINIYVDLTRGGYLKASPFVTR